MNWDDLKCVLAVARHRTFAAAADALAVTHTTVSRRISGIDRQIGCPALTRVEDGWVPTAAGQRLVDVAERMEAQIARLEEQFPLAEAQPAGLIQIATMTWIHNVAVIPGLAAFRAAHPDIRLYLFSDLFDTAKMPRVPRIALRFALPPADDEIEIPVARFDYSFHCRADVADHSALDLVAYHGGLVQFTPFNWAATDGRGDDTPALLADDGHLVAEAIAAGLGCGLIPDLVGQAYPQLRRLPPPAPRLSRNLRLLVNRNDYELPHVRCVVDWLVDHAARAAAPPEPALTPEIVV
ncbi:MAG: LysR family transcriptional regulator [Pseudomonadota bacterium]